jgi:sialic acid synthase SpsE
MNQIHIIAEAGTNHNGQLLKAKALAAIAKSAGANSVKYQMINTWGLYLPGNYKYGHYKIEDVIKLREEGKLSDDAYRELASYCQELNLSFSASVFDSASLRLLASLNPPYIKLASCDLNNLRFLREVREYGIKMVVSTGMSTMTDIEMAVKTIRSDGFDDLVLLHCVSVYPASLNQANLTFISRLKSEFGCEVGFSDHTGDSIAACIALALGATWFEKHFTENKQQVGLDHAYAMEEEGLKQYVKDIHEAFASLQPKEDKVSDAELYTRQRARRSLYAAKELPAGHIITNADVLCVRPENIMQADEIDYVIGAKLAKKINQYEPFTHGHLQ